RTPPQHRGGAPPRHTPAETSRLRASWSVGAGMRASIRTERLLWMEDTMLKLSLSDDAELRALEPWHAGEFTEFLEGARPHLAPWLPWATTITDEASAREFLQRYADR